MSEHRAERIYKPPFFRLSPLTATRGTRKRYVIGFDSEAEKGYPFLFQFAHPDGSCDLIDVPQGKDHEALLTFLDYLHKTCTRKDTEYLVFAFNLNYEYTQLFRDIDDELKVQSEIQLASADGDAMPFAIRAMNSKRHAFTITFGNSKRIIRVVDAFAYFPMSLDAASKAVGVGRKLAKPKHFERKYRHTPEFVAYASQDAILTQRLGEYVVQLHDRYDVTMTISAPHFAAKTFRRAYLKETIPLAHPHLEQYGLSSYHGGKNGFYLRRPTLLKEAYHVDIRSAYPEAMRQLPDPAKATWEFYDAYRPNAHALWRIRGNYRPCKYRCLMLDSGWAKAGPINATVTGYELDTALAHGEIELTSCEGYVMTGPSGGSLVEYVDDFYSQKRNAKSSAERVAAKLFLNSLYGKFFQKVPLGIVGAIDMGTGRYVRTDPLADYDQKAGGLYHPPIASLITGFVRAKIHGLEHRLQSMMTSTDGFFSRLAPKDDELGEGLGRLSLERGTLRIWRERLYVFDPDDGGQSTMASHGFRGTKEQLRRIPMTGRVHRYLADSMVTLKMSTRTLRGTRYAPGTFATVPFELALPDGGPDPPL